MSILIKNGRIATAAGRTTGGMPVRLHKESA